MKRNGIWKIILYVLIVLILLGIIVGTNTKREGTTVETILSYTIMPIQRGLSNFVLWIKGYKDIFPQIEELQRTNKELVDENSKIKKELADYELLLQENKMLKEQLNLTQKYVDFDTLVGTVIAYDINNWYHIIVVNQGSNDGVKEGMTVISDKGLVGYVKEVLPNTSKILCITDAGNSVSGRVTKTKEEIVCRGELGLKEKSQMKLMYIPTDIVLAVGDKVETSGIGGVYKKGIEIGEVIKVVQTTNSLEAYAIVQTSVDFSTLEYVLIII